MSYLFYKVPLWDTYCPGIPKPQDGWDNLIYRPANTYAHAGLDAYGQPKRYLEFMNRYAKYRLGYSNAYIAQTASQQIRRLIIYDNIYDVSVSATLSNSLLN